MNRFISTSALIAASALFAASAALAQTPNHQPDQNPAHQMHYTQGANKAMDTMDKPMAATSMNTMSNPMVGGAEMFATKDIVTNAMNSADHTTLVAAVKAAGLVETLQSKGPFTVFAPTNAAFDALPAGTVDTLLKPENKAKLTKILTCHVVAGAVSSAQLADMIDKNGGSYQFSTVGGCTLTAKKSNGMIWLTDDSGATGAITIADVKQSNGVIHVVDKVLLPAM